MIKKILSLLSFPALAATLYGTLSNTPVQTQTANTAGTNAATLACNLSASPTPGNTIVIAAGSALGLYISSSTGIAWQQTVTPNSTGPTVAQIFVGRALSNATGAITIGTTGATTGALSAVAAEYTTPTGLRLDQTAAGTGSSTTASTGATGTLNSSAELAVAALVTRTSGPTSITSAQNSFTIQGGGSTGTSLANTGDRTVALLSQVVSATSALTAAATVGNQQWAATMLTFEEITASTGTTYTTIPSISGR